MVRNGASPISGRSPRQLPNGDSAWALFDKPAGGGTGLRRFDWPAFLRRSETGQTNRRNTNLDGHALNGRSKTALHSAVVRLCHSRPAPFRCRFQNARSVLRHLHNSDPILIRSIERDLWRLSGIGRPVILLDTIPFRVRKAKMRPDSTRQVAAKGGNELAAFCRNVR